MLIKLTTDGREARLPSPAVAASLGLPRGSRPGHFARRASPSLLYLRYVPPFREIDAIVAFLGTLTDARDRDRWYQPAPGRIRDLSSHTSVSASKKIDPDIFD
jgi:hypothetical protein